MERDEREQAHQNGEDEEAQPAPVARAFGPCSLPDHGRHRNGTRGRTGRQRMSCPGGGYVRILLTAESAGVRVARMRKIKRTVITAALVGGLMLVPAPAAFAHPGCAEFGLHIAEEAQTAQPLGQLVRQVAPVNEILAGERAALCA
jgi:hypothetical protein